MQECDEVSEDNTIENTNADKDEECQRCVYQMEYGDNACERTDETDE